jgi:Family of unknown function (DUF6262)
MTHRRNVEGLRKSAQAKSEQVFQRVDEAIRLLLHQKRPINFKIVAEAAGVSTPYLYQNQAVRERIIHLALLRSSGMTPTRTLYTITCGWNSKKPGNSPPAFLQATAGCG